MYSNTPWSLMSTCTNGANFIPSRAEGTRQMSVREPVGPIAAFSPWNAPAITPSRKIGGALAAGCSVIVKPSEETPATALAIAGRAGINENSDCLDIHGSYPVMPIRRIVRLLYEAVRLGRPAIQKAAWAMMPEPASTRAAASAVSDPTPAKAVHRAPTAICMAP